MQDPQQILENKNILRHGAWELLIHLLLFCLLQHDAQMDYYGTRLATCSSDRTVKIFDVRNGGQILVADLRG